MAKCRLFLCVLLLAGCHEMFGPAVHLKNAEQYSRQQNYDKAIEEYRAHIADRLHVHNRPEWENPYFYLILIGDLQLLQEKPEEALKSYNEAEADGVDTSLVSDRYRSLAHWYETRGNFEKAVEILKIRREQDPILFDAMLDRVSKEIVHEEDAQSELKSQKKAQK